MKFDYIIGNPPYQAPKLKTGIKRDTNGSSTLFYRVLQRFYDKFRINMIMITPAKIGSKNILFTKGLSLYKLKGDVFNLGLEIAVWKLTNPKPKRAKIVYEDNSIEYKTEYPIYPLSKKKYYEIFNKSKKSIRNYIKTSKELGYLGPGAKKEMKQNPDEEYCYPVVVKVNSTVGKKRVMYSKINFGNKRKIVIPVSQKLYNKTV